MMIFISEFSEFPWQFGKGDRPLSLRGA